MKHTLMKRIPFLTVLLLAPLAVSQAAESRPNVVMILTDDQRHDAAGFTGNPAIHTPNLDRLAKAGLIFNNCFVNTSYLLRQPRQFHGRSIPVTSWH